MKLVKDADKTSSKKPEVSDKQAEEAFKTILKWIGEDPNREGLVETPKRVIKAFKEYFKGYHQDAEADLSKTFGDVEGYDDMGISPSLSNLGDRNFPSSTSNTLSLFLNMRVK